MSNFEEGDQAAAHAEAQDAANVGDEPDDWDFLVPLDESDSRVLDVDVGQKQVLPGIFVQQIHEPDGLVAVAAVGCKHDIDDLIIGVVVAGI